MVNIIITSTVMLKDFLKMLTNTAFRDPQVQNILTTLEKMDLHSKKILDHGLFDELGQPMKESFKIALYYIIYNVYL